MTANTKVEWADHTFSSRMRTSEVNWREPFRWNARAQREGRRYRVFCASLADVFDNEVPPEWRAELFALIEATPHLDWLLLTKRIGNVAQMLHDTARSFGFDWAADPWEHVWIGATVCNQPEADRDIPKLLATPAAKRFLSIEPMLGPVNLGASVFPWRVARTCCGRDDGISVARTWDEANSHRESYTSGEGVHPNGYSAPSHEGGHRRSAVISEGPRIDWVIAGGESGPHARPMHPDWVRSLRDQCVSARVPFFFKQWGEWADVDNGPKDDAAYDGKRGVWVHADGGHHDGELGVDFFSEHPMYRVGKKAAGRVLDGRTWDEVPA